MLTRTSPLIFLSASHGMLTAMERSDELQIVAHTTAAIAAASGLEAALQALLCGMATLTNAERGGVRLLPDPQQHIGPCRLYFWPGPETYVWISAENVPGSDTVQALDRGHGVYTPDVSAPSTIGDFSGSAARMVPRPGSSLIVPLRAGNRSIGTLHADAAQPAAFRAAQLVPLQVLADHAAGAVEQAQLREEATERLRRLELLQRISAAVNAGDDLDTMLTRVLQETATYITSTGGQVALVDDQRQLVRGRVGINLPDGLVEATVRRLYPAPHPEEDIFALAVRTGEQIVFGNDHPALHRPTEQRFQVTDGRRVLTTIRHGGEVIGVLLFLWKQQRPPTADDLSLLRLVAEQLGGAIVRARLAEAESSTREQLLAALHASATMVITYDLTGRLIRVQGASQALLGWDADVMIGRLLRDFLAPVERGRFDRRIANRVRGDRAVLQRELFFQHRLGHTVQLLVTVGPHMDGDRVVGGAGAVTDHGAIRRLQVERDAALAAHARAEGAMRTGQSVVHELASPLGAALGIAELLAADPSLPPGTAEDLHLLQAQVLRAGELLHRFGRIVRYEESETPGGPQLDLDRASRAASKEA